MKRKNYSKMSFGELMVASSQEAAAIARGDLAPVRVTHLTARQAKVEPPPAYGAGRVRAVRENLGLSQPVFARALNVSVGTVRGWEQGVRRPDGPTQRLLEVAERHPQTVLEHVMPRPSSPLEAEPLAAETPKRRKGV